ncbi:MAG: hypothetical protein IOC94_16390 [Methylocystis sp.]|nr:hypothetical protein [Methylocystis sp.]
MSNQWRHNANGLEGEKQREAHIQSQKLIAVWTQLEPLPLVVANPAPIIIGMVLFGIGHAFIYRSVSAAWPTGIFPRAMRFGGLLFFMTFLLWEFFTPHSTSSGSRYHSSPLK